MNVYFVEYIYDGIEKDSIRRGIFSTLNNDDSKLYWHYGPSYTDLDSLKNAKILKSFIGINYQNYERLDAIDDDFDISYPIQPSNIDNLRISDIDAWISPAGHVYISEYQAHIYTAQHILRCLYLDEKEHPLWDNHPDKLLLSKGYIALSHSYVNRNYDKPLSPKQCEVLLKLKDLNQDFEHYRKNIERAIDFDD